MSPYKIVSITITICDLNIVTFTTYYTNILVVSFSCWKVSRVFRSGNSFDNAVGHWASFCNLSGRIFISIISSNVLSPLEGDGSSYLFFFSPLLVIFHNIFNVIQQKKRKRKWQFCSNNCYFCTIGPEIALAKKIPCN